MGLASRIAKASAAVGGRLKADSRNNEQKYDYISADKILSVCGQALAEQEVTVIPAIAAETVDIVDRGNGKYRYDAAVTFHMIVADDEKKITAMWVGRGSDYTVPDKALYKAITSGHKYFLMKLLNIGEGNEDGEHEPAEEAPRQQSQRPQANKPVTPVTNGHKSTPATSAPVNLDAFVDECRKLHADSANACSDKQYNYLSGLIDAITGEIVTHNDIFRAMTGRETDSDNRIGSNLARGLFDWVVQEKKGEVNTLYDANKVNAIKTLAQRVQEEMSQLALN